MQELESVCAATLERVRTHYSPTVFDLWFGDLVLLSLDEGRAVFKINSDFKQSIIQNKYTGVLSDALREVIGFEVEVDIISTEKNEGISVPTFTREPQSLVSKEKRTELLEEEPNIGADIESKKIFSQYTFDNFVVGDSNKFAHAACIAVARNPATSYNPLFIYGQSGLGKTHLLYAITNEIKNTMPDVHIIYKGGADFTNELIQAIQTGRTKQFRDYYRRADVLLIDDIQFIAGKESTQEEFFHTFNALHDADKQIILTSDRPPRDIRTLEERLRTRFEWGLIADVQPPSIELRTAIILKKAEELGIVIPEDAVTFLSQKLKNSIRTIEGAIKKISAVSMLTSTPITLELCKEAISPILSSSKSENDTIDKIFELISERYGVSEEDIRSKKRNDNIAKARHLCIYLIRHLTELSLSDIGKLFSRDHATVIASTKYVKGQIESVPGMESEVNELISTLQM
ncbi:MAG: chromosomal replication initiator protein DnaA [Clostridia bacterium]|nr:chromosomal replication initiator protein DnaA [Clostridia bacterium]